MSKVAIRINDKASYQIAHPFNPGFAYPENSNCNFPIDSNNHIYGQVRDILVDLGFDNENFGNAKWNPLKQLINPGENVLIKPNLVLHFNNNSFDITAVVTNAAILRPIIDYAWKALEGRGVIVVGDSPHGNADFDKIVNSNGLKDLIEWQQNRGVNIQLVDFRKFEYGLGPQGFTKGICREVHRDPNGYREVNLGNESYLQTLPNIENLYGSDFDRSFIRKHHAKGTHRYLVAQSVLNADVVISVPKLKTHKKTGVTINLKNLVGINGDKNYLPHYRVGSPRSGGDEYPDTEKQLINIARWFERRLKDHLYARNTWLTRIFGRLLEIIPKILMRLGDPKGKIPQLGDWFGNQTTWRMCLDLNKILFFASKDGQIQDSTQRRFLSVVDGIVMGEGDGPMTPTARPLGYLAAGTNPFAVDFVCAWQMGFDPLRIPLLSHGMRFKKFEFDFDKLQVSCIKNDTKIPFRSINLGALPHRDWVGKIER